MNYACFEFKPIAEPQHRLSELEEARGRLLSVFCRDGFAVAGFAWGAVTFPEEMGQQLRELVGKTCAVLRLDGRFHIREV